MDEIIWSVTDSGEFSLKSAIVQNQSMYPAPWLEMIWFDGRFQKHALCLWMDFQKGLKTRALLAGRNIISDTTCALCGGNQEDIQHIMKECSFSTYIWFEIAAKVSVFLQLQSNWIHQMQHFFSLCDASKEDNLFLAKLCAAAFAWNIWKERNNLIFRAEKRVKELVTKGIMQQVRSRAIFLNLDVSSSSSASWNFPEVSHSRRAPPLGLELIDGVFRSYFTQILC